MARLVDQYGAPIDTARLTREEAGPSLTGVRTILSDHPSRGLTPQRLTAILLEAEEGDATRYLELAEDMEEKDLNYLAQLGTRKRAIAQLQITVEAASDSAGDVKNADLVRSVLRRMKLRQVLMGVLDAVGKGYSVAEIIWETSARAWWPRRVEWRDPRWFAFDPVDGRTLRLREGAELLPLPPYKYVVHVHEAKSGLPIRGGLARAAAWAYLFKNFTVKDWVAFAEVFGQPYRVGKYHPSATEDERSKLLRAVASIGTDAAAIIPEGMMIEFIEAARSGSVDLYERLSTYLDAQVTKAILGQTLTSDVGSGGGSRALGEVHNEVRRDIMRSDKEQLEDTLNDQLVRPVVDLNHGPQQEYPQITIGLPDELTTMEKLEALQIAVPLGLDVEVSVVRDLLGFPEPAKDAVVLRPPAAGPVAQAQRRTAPAIRSAHAAAAEPRDAIARATRDQLGGEGWRTVMEPLVDPIAALLEDATSIEEFRDRLSELVLDMDDAQLQQLVERGAFAAHLAGGMEVDLAGGGTDA
jgi:phage gp29-like protein